jgi:hypothetical protein
VSALVSLNKFFRAEIEQRLRAGVSA